MRSLLHRFDHCYTKLIQSWPAWLRPFMRVASTTGFPFVTIGIAIALFLFGWRRQQLPMVLGGLVICVTSAVGSALKLWLRRPRPFTYKAKRWFFSTFSFPSGHSTGATAAYGVTGILLLQSASSLVATLVATTLFLWIIVIGLSRVYLGAHYPSDVIAGWLLGAGGVLAFCLIVR